MIGVMDNEAHILITQNTSARLNVILDAGGPVTRPVPGHANISPSA